MGTGGWCSWMLDSPIDAHQNGQPGADERRKEEESRKEKEEEEGSRKNGEEEGRRMKEGKRRRQKEGRRKKEEIRKNKEHVYKPSVVFASFTPLRAS